MLGAPSFVCTFCRAGGSAAVWVAHELLALRGTLAPESFLLALVGAVRADVALRVAQVLLAVVVLLSSCHGVPAVLWARLVEAVLVLQLVLTALLQSHLVLVGLHTL